MLTVHVQPKASRTECVGLYGTALKIRVAAPPIEGAANEALAQFLADRLGLPLAAVDIRSGEASRHKRVLLRGIALHTVKERLRV